MDSLISTNSISDVVNRINNDGICILKNYVKEDDLINIENEFDNILITHKDSLDKNSGLNKCIRTNINTNIINQNNNKTIYNLYENRFIKDITNKILGNFKYDNIFIHHDIECNNTNNTYPHFDFDRKLKFYLCVNKMNIENGCFKALPGKIKLVEEKRKINRRKNIFIPGHKFYNGTEIKMNELISIECNEGDLIIFDTNCIHAGGDKFEKGKYRKVIRLHLSKIV